MIVMIRLWVDAVMFDKLLKVCYHRWEDKKISQNLMQDILHSRQKQKLKSFETN